MTIIDKMRIYFDKDEYIAVHGAGNLIGTSTLVQSHLDRRGEGAEEVLRRLKIAEASNEKAREQMERELKAGEIRFMTVTEKLIAQARGHEDNEATRAARRCLAKRGIIYGK